MDTLLKDMPIHAERIENNYLLGKELEDALDDAEFDESYDDCKNEAVSAIVDALRQADFAINNNEIKIEDPELLAQAIWKVVEDALDGNVVGEISNKTEIASKVRETLTEFVNQNYEWKGLKA